MAFGSAADPQRVDEARDLDLAVSWTPAVHRDLVAVVNALIDLTGFSAVDVMDLDRAGVVAREQALVRGQPLFEDGRGVFATMQMAATTERMDTAWLRRLRLEALAG